MDKICIEGGRPLKGRIEVSGAKNAALPLLTAALLSDQTLTLKNLPHLADITTLVDLLTQLGVSFAMDGDPGNGGHTGRVMTVHAKEIRSTIAPYDLVRKMRASVLVLGPLLARCGTARVSLPGGCAIGARPVDLHLQALEALGAEIDLREGYVEATAPKGLVGAPITFPQVSVGATENLLMAATLAKGQTELMNAAREPEVADLARCLQAMGAKIEGIGTDHLKIEGVTSMQPAEHAVIVDRIELGTYMMAAAITRGDVELVGGRLDLVDAAADALMRGGVGIAETEAGLRVSLPNGTLNGVDVMTEPFPGFPTDLQAQFMALMSTASGAAMITETIFENRFMHVPELTRMGANINLHGSSAMVRGVDRLNAAPVMATDLRASVSLVLAGLAAKGETTVNRVYHLDRGYEHLEQKLAACGAQIARVRD